MNDTAKSREGKAMGARARESRTARDDEQPISTCLHCMIRIEFLSGTPSGTPDRKCSSSK